jgi:hypothetical protein
MKPKTIAAALILLIFAAPCFLQNFACADENVVNGGSLVWEKTFGGTFDDRAFYATATDDGVLVVGSTRSIIANQTIAWAIQLDQAGNPEWNRTYSAFSEFRYIINLPDGFLLVGNTFPVGVEPVGCAMKIDFQGNSEWNITLGSQKINRLFSAAKAADGFVLAGLTQTQDDAPANIWLTKINNNGNLLWNKIYNTPNDDAARAIATLDGNTFFVAGYSDTSGDGNFDFLLLKIDADGNQLSSQTYGGTESDKAYTLTPAGDGFVVAGDTRSEGAGDSDALIIKINQNLEQQWKHTFGGSGFDSPTYIKALADGSGFVVCGTTFSFGNGYRDFWLLKLDNNGNQLTSCTMGRNGYEESYSAVEVSKESFVVAGWVSQTLQGAPYDFYVVKVALENSLVWWQTSTGLAAIFAVVAFVVVGLLLVWVRLVKKGK